MKLPKRPKSFIKTMSKKKKILLFNGLILIPLLCILAGFLIYKKSSSNTTKQNTQTNAKQMKNGFDELSTSSGTLSSVTDSLNYDLKLSTDLEVSEVCVSSGDSVINGTALLTLTEDSVTAATKELEDALESAENTLAQEQITYSEGMLDAKYQLLEDSEADNVAATKYKQKIKELKDKVSSAKEAYDEAKSIKKNYPAKITKKENTLSQKQTEMNSLESTLNTAKQSLETFKNSLLANEESYTTANTAYLKSLGYYESLKAAYDTAAEDSTIDSAVTDYLSKLVENAKTVTSDKETTMKDTKNTYENAKTDYSTCEKSISETSNQKDSLSKEIESLSSEIEKLNTELSQAKKNLSSLKTAYQTAINNQMTEAVNIENEYAEQLLTSDSASSNYNITVAQLEKALEEATDTKDTAKENLEAFNRLINNNQVGSTKEGIVASVGYSVSDLLTSSTPIISYSENILSTTVSIDQSDIGDLAVGDSCTINGNNARCNGTISAISQATSSESISDVTFEVTITLEDTAIESGFASGDSVTVLFNMEMGNMKPNTDGNINNSDKNDEKTTDENTSEEVKK